MTSYTVPQTPSPMGKRPEAVLQEPYHSPQQCQRPAKLRRLGSDESTPLPASQAPYHQLMAGSRSNPIVLGDDADDDHEEVSAAGPGRLANLDLVTPQNRPLFLQLRECLSLVLAMLPIDISRQYVFEQCIRHRNLAADKDVCVPLIFEAFLAISADYPKEPPESAAMFVPPDSPAEVSRWQNTWKEYKDPALYHFFACNSLAVEFPLFERAYIEYLFVTKGCLYLTYLILSHQAESNLTAKSWTVPRVSLAFCGGIKGSPVADPGHIHVVRELAAAIQSCQDKVPIRQKTPVVKQTSITEDSLLSEVVVECLCCFTDSSLDQIVTCSSQTSHQFCHDCVRRFVDTLLGDMKCRPTCFAVGHECQSAISSQELRRCLPPATLDLLLDRQLHEDVKDLGITMAECPFCDYAEELTDVENTRWLICKNTKCAKTSCITCRELAHMPMSCEEARASKKKTDDTLTEQHILEEAMTAALMRKCNKCKVPFVKTDGCNSMVCPRSGCRNKQCYVCGTDIADYGHFGKRCTLHDTFTVEDRHRQEVHTAQEATIVKIRQRNPLISAADLKGKQPMHYSPSRIQRGDQAKLEKALAQRTQEPVPARHYMAARSRGSFRLDQNMDPPRAPPPPTPPMANRDHLQRESANWRATMTEFPIPNYNLPPQLALPQPAFPKPSLPEPVLPQPAPPESALLQPHHAFQPFAAPLLWGTNEWDAKGMAALRNRLDGIPMLAPVPAAVPLPPQDNYQPTAWGRDLLDRLGHAGQVDLNEAPYMPGHFNQQTQDHGLQLPSFLHVPRWQSTDQAGAQVQSGASSSNASFATLAARTAMRPDPVGGRYI